MEKVVLTEDEAALIRHRTKGRGLAPCREATRGPRDGGDGKPSCREGAGRIHGVRAAHRWKRDAPRVPDREGLGEVSWLAGFVSTNREGSGWLSKPQSRTPHGRDAGTGEWTKKIKTQLCTAGAAQQPPLYVCASDVETANNGEWLYDVCWLRYGKAAPLAELHADHGLDCLAEAVLILECEWADGGMALGRIRDDFQKLLVGRARVRYMIWEDNKGEDDSAVAEWLVGMMSESLKTAPDGFYLLARYTDEGFQYWHLYGNGTVYPM